MKLLDDVVVDSYCTRLFIGIAHQSSEHIQTVGNKYHNWGACAGLHWWSETFAYFVTTPFKLLNAIKALIKNRWSNKSYFTRINKIDDCAERYAKYLIKGISKNNFYRTNSNNNKIKECSIDKKTFDNFDYYSTV